MANILVGRVVTVLLAANLAIATPVGTKASILFQENQNSSAPAPVPHGKKLVLKDGDFQLVREYKVEGDRVRYYSVERSAWEEIPAELVDWEKTKEAEAEEAKRNAAVLARLRAEEEARKAALLEVDASVEAAPGIFLPQDKGLYAFDGKAIDRDRKIVKLVQAETNAKIDKGRAVTKIFVPLPLPAKQIISIKKARAEIRFPNGQPEFYLRVDDDREPSVELVRAKVGKDTRQIAVISELFGERETKKDALSLQIWQVTPSLYRFTLGETLPPGEYALVQIIHAKDDVLLVWDFGIDPVDAPKTNKK